MIEFVVREGPMFEAMIMNREINNPMYRWAPLAASRRPHSNSSGRSDLTWNHSLVLAGFCLRTRVQHMFTTDGSCTQSCRWGVHKIAVIVEQEFRERFGEINGALRAKLRPNGERTTSGCSRTAPCGGRRRSTRTSTAPTMTATMRTRRRRVSRRAPWRKSKTSAELNCGVAVERPVHHITCLQPPSAPPVSAESATNWKRCSAVWLPGGET